MIEKIRDIFYNSERSFEALLKILFMSSFKTDVIKREKSKECVVFGNGPSLNKLIEEHGSFLKDRDVASVSLFPNADIYKDIKPTFHVISAPDFWRYDSKPQYFDLRKEFFENLSTKTDWPLDFYIPVASKKYPEWKETIKRNPNIKHKYYNYTPIEGFSGISHWAFRNNLGMPRPHNVLVPTIMLAINLGYKVIHLWGADHSWLPLITVNNDNHVLVNNRHFYDESSTTPQRMNKPGNEYRKLHEVLEKLLYSFQSYFVIKQYAEKNGVKIINGTPNSFIDAFERTNYK